MCLLSCGGGKCKANDFCERMLPGQPGQTNYLCVEDVLLPATCAGVSEFFVH